MLLRTAIFAFFSAAALQAASIKHEFIAIDEGNNKLLYVNENEPAKDWIVVIGKSHPRDMQLVGNNRILIGNVTGYTEYDIATGKILKDVSSFAPATAPTDTDEVTSVRRLPNGHTLVAGLNIGGSKGLVVLDVDAQDQLTHKTVYEGTYIRLLRQTAKGTYLMVCDKEVREGDTNGAYVWKASLGIQGQGHAWKAVRLPNGNTLASAGYGAFMAELDPLGKLVRRFGSASEVPAAVKASFYATFQLLPNGDVVVANWQGHGPGHGNSGIQLLEYDKAGAIVWQWSKPEIISSIQGVLVLDNLNTRLLHDERNGIMEPLPEAGDR
jgi:hypothetical protein